MAAAFVGAGCGASSTTATPPSTKPSTVAPTSSSSFALAVENRGVAFNLDLPNGVDLHVTKNGKELGVEFKAGHPTHYRVVVRLVHTDLPMEEFANEAFAQLVSEPDVTLSEVHDRQIDGRPGKEAVFTTTSFDGKVRQLRVEVTACRGVALMASCTAYNPKWEQDCLLRLGSLKILNCD